jgi:Zn-dependent protease with chaperone function
MFDLHFFISAIIVFLIFCVITFHRQAKAALSKKQRGKRERISDKKVERIAKEKCGIELKSFYLVRSEKPYGMMAGIPGKPIMILSNEVYEEFNDDEKEYVVLHELGHYALWHSTKEGFFGIFLLLAGIAVVALIPEKNHQILFSILIGLLIGILNIQFGRFSEYQADRYALKRIGNPAGMLTASHKFQKAWRGEEKVNRFVEILFYRSNPYQNRINMALDEVERRKTLK